MAEILQSIERILAEDERPVASRPERHAPANTDEAEDVLELTEAVDADGTVRQLIPIGRVSRPQPPLAAEPAAVTQIEPATSPSEPRPRDEPAALTTVEPSAPATREAAAAPLEDVIILPPPATPPPTTVTAVTPPPAAPLAAHSEPPPAINAGSRTLDELVAELLRPMLKAWLDAHLPAIVERMVRTDTALSLDQSGKPADPG